jgi:hypothetical protein
MTKDFIPYEQALELKQLGFDEPCFGCYEPNGALDYIENHILKDFPYLAKNSEWQDLVAAPTFSHAFRWFKQNHKLKFHIREDIWNAWCYVHILMQDEYENVGAYSTYEESELECLKKLIQIVKQKQ